MIQRNRMAILICLPVLWTGCGAQEDSGCQDAYSQVLSDFQQSEEATENAAFSLYDISGDGVPELVVSADSSHPAACQIYTYTDKAVLVDTIGSYGCITYDPDRNWICSYNLGQGAQACGYYQMKRDALELQISFYDTYGARGEEGVFQIDGKDVDKETYDTQYEFYSANTSDAVSLGRDFALECADAVLSGEYLSEADACAILRQQLRPEDASILYTTIYPTKKYQGKCCYLFQVRENHLDHAVTIGWYAVDLQTGVCYDTKTLTDLVPLESGTH